MDGNVVHSADRSRRLLAEPLYTAFDTKVAQRRNGQFYLLVCVTRAPLDSRTLMTLPQLKLITKSSLSGLKEKLAF